MNSSPILLTERDALRLTEMVQALRETVGRGSGLDLEPLEAELARAQRVAPDAVPPDVVTMNSTVAFRDLDSGAELRYTLAWPAEADPAQGRISVLAPVGTALLGARVGDVVQWTVPAGLRRFRVERVLYQPEAAGHPERAPTDRRALLRLARVASLNG